MNLNDHLLELKGQRKVFHSEADFQFALAWEIQKKHPNAKVRLEYCLPQTNRKMHIDILVIIGDEQYPIEVKYKTLKVDKVVENEAYNLTNQTARDQGRYDFLLDVERIELLHQSLPGFKKGYALMLTNDNNYWKNPQSTNTVDAELMINEGIVKHGEMQFADHASEGTKKGRIKPISLRGAYTLQWNEYSQIGSEKFEEFKYLLVTIG
jgi:hypothetical protein